MINSIFEKLNKKQTIAERLSVARKGKTWEQTSIHLYSILSDIRIEDNRCKGIADAFLAMVERMQVRKNRFLFSEAVATVGLGTRERQIKKYYKKYGGLNGTLTKSTYSSESNQLKFWVLTDGTILPVRHAHSDTIQSAGVHNLTDFSKEGAFAGYVEDTELGLRNWDKNAKLTSDQILAVTKLYNKYSVDTLLYDVGEQSHDYLSIPSVRDLSNALRGGGRKKKAWEAVDEGYIYPDDFLNAVAQEVIGKRYQDATKDERILVRKEIPNYNPDARRYKADRGSNLFPAHERVVEGNLADHAEYELRLAGLFDEDSDYNGMLGEAVLELMQTFGEQGHSGFSAGLTIDLFQRLASFQALTELTNNPDEWNDVTEFSAGPMWQNSRQPSVFSEDGGTTYYDLDELRVEHEDEDGSSYSTYEGDKEIHTSKVFTV